MVSVMIPILKITADLCAYLGFCWVLVDPQMPGSKQKVTAIWEAHHRVKQSFFWGIWLCDFRTKYDMLKFRVYTPEIFFQRSQPFV